MRCGDRLLSRGGYRIDEGEAVRSTPSGGVVPAVLDRKRGVQSEPPVQKIACIDRQDCAGEALVAVEQSAKEIGSRVGGGTTAVRNHPGHVLRCAVGGGKHVLNATVGQSGDCGRSLTEGMAGLLVGKGPERGEDGAGQAGAAPAALKLLLPVNGDHDGNAGIGVSQRRDIGRLPAFAGKRRLPRWLGPKDALAAATSADEAVSFRRV